MNPLCAGASRRITVATTCSAFALALTALIIAPAAEASIVDFDLSFSDSATHASGTGSFRWNTDTEIMSDLSWDFSGKQGSVKNASLASVYHSWDPLATTYGELFFRYLTQPQAYLIANYGLLGSSVGLMPSNVVGDFGFIAFGAEKQSSLGTYRFLNSDWSLAGEGYVTATVSSVPEPASLLLSVAALALLAVVGRQRQALGVTA